jgi:hypothetical protein
MTRTSRTCTTILLATTLLLSGACTSNLLVLVVGAFCAHSTGAQEARNALVPRTAAGLRLARNGTRRERGRGTKVRSDGRSPTKCFGAYIYRIRTRRQCAHGRVRTEHEDKGRSAQRLIVDLDKDRDKFSYAVHTLLISLLPRGPTGAQILPLMMSAAFSAIAYTVAGRSITMDDLPNS